MPNRLEYEVALYKEAPPIARVSGTNNPVSSSNDPPSLTASKEQTVDQAVPLGTKLQLRARISQSVWKYVKLMEVTVSPDSGKFNLIEHLKRIYNLNFIILFYHCKAILTEVMIVF